MTHVPRRVAACVGLLAMLVTGCGTDAPGGEASPACEAPSLHVQPTTVAREEALTVTGAAFTDGCADSCHVDADTGEQTCETAAPHRAIAVELVTGDGESVALASVSADENGDFTVELVVPADAPEGPASVTADVVSTEPAHVTIVP